MITIASGFQYSVNIGYDLYSDDKLKNFIPTKSALQLLADTLLSTRPSSTERARMLIGAYGKGKSHIVLTILAMLMRRDLSLFEKLLPKAETDGRLYQYIQNYYESGTKLLPVIIPGSNTSLTQAFLMALQRTLMENDMMDVMPDTNYHAAISVIARWEKDFPETYAKLEELIGYPLPKLIEELEDYSITAYEAFEKAYPSLTAGSVFNPFLGFDVVDLYESVAKGVRKKGYSGLYVVYDEFSKFLEANIAEASVSDTKMLQDFAEKCNRSGETQMHLMLICHKEIANYIDTLPKQKVDGWRGVSERFLHVHLNNNFTQTYEIIASVIQKPRKRLWSGFLRSHKKEFDGLLQRYQRHPIFSDMSSDEIIGMVKECYPLHPVSTFILPRLSERVAQNERTLFTFLSASGTSTLPAFLDAYEDTLFQVITPDMIYDYFEPLFKKEAYVGGFQEIYQLTSIILEKLDVHSLESKIIKTLSLIYILEQFEKLKPTEDELVAIYSVSYIPKEIEQAIKNLIEREFVIYLKRSNNYLRLKQTSGVDVHQKIQDMVASLAGKVSVKDTLNNSNFDSYMYPSQYNDEKEMTRYFSFVFLDESEVAGDTNWEIKSESIAGDGIIYGIIPQNASGISTIKDALLQSSEGYARFIFVLPKKYIKIEDVAQEFYAVSMLRDLAVGDKVLFDEYEVIYDDLREVLEGYIATYTHPELFQSSYIYSGTELPITRKAALTSLMSQICDEVYYATPVINNEVINRDDVTGQTNASRSKIVVALLRNEIEKNLGFTGSGPEISIMRSTLVRTGVLAENENGSCYLNIAPENELVAGMLNAIVEFVQQARHHGTQEFAVLYEHLTAPEHGIGLRRGLIPIYIAAVFHEYKKELIIHDRQGLLPINSDTLLQINADPTAYQLTCLDWSPEKEAYIQGLSNLFSKYVVNAEETTSAYEYVALAMRRWYMSLPKYAKEHRTGDADPRFISMMQTLRQNVDSAEMLFTKLPQIFGCDSQFGATLVADIRDAKEFYDGCLGSLKRQLVQRTKDIFAVGESKIHIGNASLPSVIKDWCESLDPSVFEQIFADGTERCLALFKAVTNDEDTFVSQLAKTVTGLRLEDWDDSFPARYADCLEHHKETAEGHHSKQVSDKVMPEANMYQISYIDTDGQIVTKRFDRVEQSKRAELLLRAIQTDLESMGQAVSEGEKRQILMEILKKLC